MIWPVQLITAPTLEPLSLADAKAHLRLEGTLDDAAIDKLILAARKHVEKLCNRGLVTQTWELVMPAFPEASCPPSQRNLPASMQLDPGIELPKGNLSSVTSVKYIDTAGVQQTLASTEYTVDAVSEPAVMRLAYGKSWPGTRAQWDAVRIRYVVGWAVADVPEPLVQAIKLLVSQMYEHRTPEVTGAIVSALEFSFDALLSPYRLVTL